MTVRELRQKLFELENQDAEILVNVDGAFTEIIDLIFNPEGVTIEIAE